MAFADPQSFKYDGTTAESFARTALDITGGEFRNNSFTSASAFSGKLSVQHQYAKRIRRTVRFDMNWTDVIPVGPNNVISPLSNSVYLVLDTSPYAGPAIDAGVVEGLALWLTASTNANTLKFVNGEV